MLSLTKCVSPLNIRKCLSHLTTVTKNYMQIFAMKNQECQILDCFYILEQPLSLYLNAEYHNKHANNTFILWY